MYEFKMANSRKPTVREMAVSGLKCVPQKYALKDEGMHRGEFSVPDHTVDPDLRFNFPNKANRIPQAKTRRYIDQLMTAKAKIPSPG